MIRVTLSAKRHASMRAVLDLGDPDERTLEVLEHRDRTLLPIRHAQSFDAWLGRVQAHLGLGFPDRLHELRAYVRRSIDELEHHPAMYGHGMVGWQSALPMTCWKVPDARRPEALYVLEPIGTEGVLVPIQDRQDKGVRITYWHFEPMAHGGPRPDSTMFRSAFATRRRSDPTQAQAVAAEVRAAVLERAQADRTAQAPVAEDGSDVP